jgi:hypothetical protein
VERLVFPRALRDELPVELVSRSRALDDDDYYSKTLEGARELALKRVSFSRVKDQLLQAFARLDKCSLADFRSSPYASELCR